MLKSSFRLFDVRGIPIKAHWSFLLILPLLAILYAQQYVSAARLAGIPPEALTWHPWAWGLLVAVGLFASVTVHELAHSLYAVHAGVQVRSITLLMIGGISEITEPPRRPTQEALMAFVGPLTSLVLGGVLLAVWYGSRGLTSFDLQFALLTLGEINVVLGLFNLLPAFPMDGGRILRGLLTGPLGATRATQVASSIGKAFAVLFGLAGLLGGSIVLVMVAFFVWMGAQAEGTQAVMREVLGDVHVRDVAGPVRGSVDANATIDQAIAAMREARTMALPVLDGETVTGVVTLEGLASVDPDRRAFTAVRQVAREVAPVAPGDEAWTVLKHMATDEVPELPVVEDGRLVATINQDDLVRHLRFLRLREPGLRGLTRRPVTG